MPKPNPSYIVSTEQQIAKAPMSMQTKQNTCFNQRGNIFTLNGSSLKLVDKYTNIGSCVSVTENDINMRQAKAWIAIDRLSVTWKSDLSIELRHSFFQVAIMSILLYGCTTGTLAKRMEKKLKGNYTKMLQVLLNKSWR